MKYIKTLIWLLLILIIGFGGYYYFKTKSQNVVHADHLQKIYTCSMHPEIIRDAPGNCPICGMALVQKSTESAELDTDDLNSVIQPTDQFIVGDYNTTTAIDSTIKKEINLPGIIAYNPNSATSIAARISGRIEKLYVKYKYQSIGKGDKLFEIYSPELLTEQQNLIYLIKNDAENNTIIQAAREKLLLYGMSENQIANLEISKTINPIISIFSPVNGIIVDTENKEIAGIMPNNALSTESISVKEGSYIQKNVTVFKLLNTNKVWGVFNIFEGYNRLIIKNMTIEITPETDANLSFKGKIDFIETQINENEKTNRFRVYLDNNLKLPIGTRLKGVLSSKKIKGIWIKKQSYITLGSKQVVFIKNEKSFYVKEIKTGIEINDYVQILSGLTLQDKIAENAQYLTDSESFVKVK